MGDMAEVFKDLKEQKKKRHSNWHKLNMAIMGNSQIGYEVKNCGEVLIINSVKSETHICGKPQVEFWPSTGRWRARGKMFRGGAKSFLNWYEKQ